MKIQINDCTIRDGGYLLDKNSPEDFVKGIVAGLIDAGIDIIESGFLQDKGNGETLVYRNSVDARKFVPADMKKSAFTGFCDNSRYSVENLDDYDGKAFEYLRISFAKHEWRESIKFAEEAGKKGYKVFVNPMDAPGYTEEERAEVIKAVNKIKPYAFSIVDTFGIMYLDDLKAIFKQVDSMLDKSVRIGLHSHDNLQLSCALAEIFIDMAVEADRDVVVDGSLYGMGRGAGNAATEVIANYINRTHGGTYNLPALFETIEKYMVPLKKDVFWGYDIPMFICGVKKSHVDNIYHLKKEHGVNTSEIFEILERLPVEKRKRYAANYSKTDFTDLEKAFSEYSERK